MWPTRYNYFVDNFAEFPRELFAAAASLPPCGSNTSASRTWVDFYDATGKRLNGFCALGTPGDLNKIWFALESDLIPPSYVYIELNDGQTTTKYKSNLARPRSDFENESRSRISSSTDPTPV